MKVILSRKGFDAEYGGFASPILPDGRLISLPVPALPGEDKRIHYGDLFYDKNQRIVDLMLEMGEAKIKIPRSKKSKSIKKKYNWTPPEKRSAHLDPDLRKIALKREQGWKGLFGQSYASQTHLEETYEGVGKNDLFLFFGWFKKYCYDGSGKLVLDVKDQGDYPTGRHAIFGYLQIDDIIHLDQKEAFNCVEPWMKYHPHVGKNLKFLGSQKWFGKNALYVAKDTLKGSKRLRGFGPLSYSKSKDFKSSIDLTLTKKGCSRSKWNLPLSIFKDAEISYHHSPWKKSYFQSANKGQEFVIKDNAKVEKWAMSLIKRFSDI